MGHLYPRYNAKARATQRLGKQDDRGQGAVIDERDTADPSPMPQPPKMSGKKRKRFEAFVERKLKKEKRVEILKSLEKSQKEVDALPLRGSATLGSKSAKSNQDKLEHKQEIANRRKANSVATLSQHKNYHSQSESEPEDKHAAAPQAPPAPTVIADSSFSGAVAVEVPTVQPAGTIGSGLALGAATVIVKRKKKERLQRFQKDNVKPHLRDLQVDSDQSSDESMSEQGSLLSDEDEEFAGFGSVEGEEIIPDAVSDEEDDTSDSDSDSEASETERKGGSFKEWAQQQIGLSGETQLAPDLTALTKPSTNQIHKRGNEPLRGPLGAELSLPANSLLQPSLQSKKKFVLVERDVAIQEARMQLPILKEEDAIMELIRLNAVVVLCGETGSGKTTQVPQFLFEEGFGSPGSDNPGMIAITQPRRVAAVSMASRVATELNLPATRVSYQIRYDTTTSPSTSIKFMTDGVLLRELANDFLLTRYSVVIVDEAHERSVNTDVLIGVLSRVVRLREKLWREEKPGAKPLRLIIMSATLRVTDFVSNTTLFSTPPPLIEIKARQHPVTLHYNRVTHPDYITEAYKKVCKIHSRLPDGGVLIFLTGQGEIEGLVRKLEKRFGRKAIEQRKKERLRRQGILNGPVKPLETLEEPVESGNVDANTAPVEIEEMELGGRDDDLAADVDDGIEPEDLEALDTDGEDEELDTEESDVPMHVLPLYSLLPQDKQMRVFKPPPADSRLIVVATNVAETSLTIPNIRYVVDCGRAKDRHYDQASGIQSFEVSWISKASAMQRAGRAGRTGPGHCYRLFSSAVYESHLPQHTPPEILAMPIEGIVLQMKAMNIDNVVNFPFPTPPDRHSLRKAEDLLFKLGALSQEGNKYRITDLGKAMSLFPLSPRFAKMLVVGQQHGCLPYVIAIVSALSVGDPFLRPANLGLEDDQEVDLEEAPELKTIENAEVRAKEERRLLRRNYYKSQEIFASLGDGISDIFKMLSVVGAYEFDGGSSTFCDANFVRAKAMQEIHKLRAQITKIVQSNFPALKITFDPSLQPPSETQLKVIRQLLTAAFIDQVAIRADLVDNTVPSAKRFTSTRGVAYRTPGTDEDIYIHPSSLLFHSAPPEFVIYGEMVRTDKVWIRCVTKISGAWLSTLGKPLCTYTKVAEQKSITNRSITTTDGEERTCLVTPCFGGLIELQDVKMKQKRIGSKWVYV